MMVDERELRCSGCEETKPLSAFNRRTDRARGFASQCKSCKILRRSEEANKKRKLGMKLWRAKNPEQAKLATQRWRAKNVDAVKAKRRAGVLRAYGLTVETFDLLFEKQGRCCPVCETRTPSGKGWAVDHDHKTGAVRGILCSKCNTALGLLDDDLVVIAAAADYLRRTV